MIYSPSRAFFSEISFSLISQLPGYVQLPSIRYLLLQSIINLRVCVVICSCSVVVGESIVPVYGNEQVGLCISSELLEFFQKIYSVTLLSAYFGHACERVHNDMSAQAIGTGFRNHCVTSESLKALVIRWQTAWIVLRQRHPYRCHVHRLYRDAYEANDISLTERVEHSYFQLPDKDEAAASSWTGFKWGLFHEMWVLSDSGKGMHAQNSLGCWNESEQAISGTSVRTIATSFCTCKSNIWNISYIGSSEFYIPPKSAHEGDAARVCVRRMTRAWNDSVKCSGIEPKLQSMTE